MSCATDEQATVRCWGDNTIHPGDTAWYDMGEARPPEMSGVVDVRLSVEGVDSWYSGFGCAFLSDASIRCWGDVYNQPASDYQFVAFDLGRDDICGIDVAGGAKCWVGSNGNIPGWTEIADLTKIRAGAETVCLGKSDGLITCGPTNGDSASATYPNPPGSFLVAVPNGSVICGVSTSGDLSCWDQATASPSTTLIPPSDRAPYKDLCLAGEWGWGCALDNDGHAECFGDYDTEHYPWHEPVPDDVTFATLSCGANHACGLTTDGQVRCFGNNSYGQANLPAM